MSGSRPAELAGGALRVTRAWEPRDVMLYALAVGAGPAEPELTTEADLRVLPTFAFTLLFDNGGRLLGDSDQTQVLHAEQTLHVPAPLPVAGTAHVTIRVADVFDKGGSAFVVEEAEASDAATGRLLARGRSTMVIRGAGGWGGDRGPSVSDPLPDRSPDVEVELSTRTDQALLYRLCGDRNPLHADPAFARRGGFDAPILHGLCTLGASARVLGLPGGLNCRFTSPVVPGEGLRAQAWREPGSVRFRTLAGDGRIVIDRGRATPSGAP